MFQVEWRQVALDQLTEIWLKADSTLRGEITKASDTLEQLLKIDPMNVGESRPNGRRIAFEFPLSIRFRVLRHNQTVRITHVRAFKKRHP